MYRLIVSFLLVLLNVLPAKAAEPNDYVLYIKGGREIVSKHLEVRESGFLLDGQQFARFNIIDSLITTDSSNVNSFHIKGIHYIPRGGRYTYFFSSVPNEPYYSETDYFLANTRVHLGIGTNKGTLFNLGLEGKVVGVDLLRYQIKTSFGLFRGSERRLSSVNLTTGAGIGVVSEGNHISLFANYGIFSGNPEYENESLQHLMFLSGYLSRELEDLDPMLEGSIWMGLEFYPTGIQYDGSSSPAIFLFGISLPIY